MAPRPRRNRVIRPARNSPPSSTATSSSAPAPRRSSSATSPGPRRPVPGTDNLQFDTESGDYVAEGNVRYQDSGIRIIAERAEGNQNNDLHTISNINYQLVDRRGNGGADSIRLTGPLGQMSHSTYSTCDPSQPMWELRAQQIDVDSDEGFGVARRAVLRMGNFPVLYVPWFKFPIDDRRLTGLLYPSVSTSGRNGFDYKQPIYLNLAPNYDLTWCRAG